MSTMETEEKISPQTRLSSEFTILNEGLPEGYICKRCKATYLNRQTGRCGKCNFQSQSLGYCKTCDNFYSLLPGQLCPQDGTKLLRQKATPASLRLVNFVLDTIIIYILGFPVGFLAGLILASCGLVVQDVELFVYAFGLFYTFSYYVVFETLWQRTPAKFVTGTKVVTYDGEKPTPRCIALRTLGRLVPFEAFSFLDNKVYGWHDSWSRTFVVRSRRTGAKVTRIKTTASEHTACQCPPLTAEQLPHVYGVRSVNNVSAEAPSIVALLEREQTKDMQPAVPRTWHGEQETRKVGEADTFFKEDCSIEENQIGEVEEAWKRPKVESGLMKATAQNWDKYPRSTQATIEAEARSRGLWEQILRLSKENAESAGPICSATTQTKVRQQIEWAVLAGLLVILIFVILLRASSTRPPKTAREDSYSARVPIQKETPVREIPAPGVIDGIGWSGKGERLLMLDGQIFREGETVKGSKIYKVHEDRVEYEKYGQIWVQTMSMSQTQLKV